MRNFFTTNIPMKLLSLVLASALWLYLVVLLNPETDMLVTGIPVVYTNHQSLAVENFTIASENQFTVDLKLKGKRNMLSNVNKNNIIATVDLSGYTKAGTYSLPIHIQLPYEEIAVVEKMPYNVSVFIDKITTMHFPVTIGIIGSPKENSEVYSPITAYTSVEVKGPQQILNTIDKAVVNLDVTGAEHDLIETQKIKLLNTNGDEINNKALNVNPEKVEVRCQILTKKVVPIKPVIIDGEQKYEVLVLSNSELSILAKKEILDAIAEIQTEPINPSQIKEPTKIVVPLNIPSGVHIQQEIKEITVEVRLKNEIINQ